MSTERASGSLGEMLRRDLKSQLGIYEDSEETISRVGRRRTGVALTSNG